MNNKINKILEDLKNEIEIFFKENKDKERTKIYKYSLVPFTKKNIYIYATSKTENLHCFVSIFNFGFFNVTIFDKKGKNLKELLEAALKISEERDELLGKWEQEAKACIKKLKHRDEKRNKRNFEYIKNKTRTLSKNKLINPRYILKHTEISEIEEFIKQGKGTSYFTLRYGPDYALNLVINPNKRIIGAIGTFRYTFLFEDYSKSLDSLLDNSKVKFNEHEKLISETNSENDERI